MKKIIMFAVAILIVSVVATISFYPSVAQSQKTTKSLTTSIPENVKTILQNSCAKCHGDNGNGMAMGVWNLNQWDTYTAAKQAKKANAICKAATNGSMPPKSFTGAKPTAAQISEICTWATSIQIKK